MKPKQFYIKLNIFDKITKYKTVFSKSNECAKPKTQSNKTLNYLNQFFKKFLILY